VGADAAVPLGLAYTVGRHGAGSYRLGGTAGQADASVLAAGRYRLRGGFWGGAGPMYPIYLPLVLRGS
jgi:hypothetical protein